MEEAGAIAVPNTGRPRLTRQTAFTSPDTHPLALDHLLADKYGVNWLVWEPETLWATLTRDFRIHTEISKLARAGIQAVKTVHCNDTFFTDWQVTLTCTQALDGCLPDFEVLQDTSPGQIWHAFECARMLRGNMPYADEVQGWMAACFLDDGMIYSPEPLDFLQDNIAQVEAHCPKCGNVEWAEGLTECPSCGTDRDQLKIKPKFEWKDVQERWNFLKNKDLEDVVLREDRIGVQMAKLFASREHMRSRLALLNDQLEELGYAGIAGP